MGDAHRDHPRSRGVYETRETTWGSVRGSSPLARGLLTNQRRFHNGFWIIPARAGFTSADDDDITPRPDHPRSRGVYPARPPLPWAASGSSPLARGLRRRRRRPSSSRRIIPARAGFTRGVPHRRGGPGDHPRSRGVYLRPPRMTSMRAGSSPLARGLRMIQALAVFGGGIIPARAGFTEEGDVHGRPAGDHPRSRGVYQRRPSIALNSLGSSPLARGLPSTPGSRQCPSRIIPARAGFTHGLRARRHLDRDHPRSRGVYAARKELDGVDFGSSPLARGLHVVVDSVVEADRIIPARAGFTLLRSPSAAPAGDHPRSRGVYCCCTHLPSASPGSSPLARGLLMSTRSRRCGRGIIPARAGFTRRARPRGPDRRDHPRSRGVYPARKRYIR